MTKIAIISDIHANMDALRLILKDIERRNVDKIVCLGDLVTKYFYPAEVVDAVRSNADIVLKGNCDNLVASDERYKFAREKLGLDRIEYLANLPVTEQLIVNKALVNMYHSTPHDLEAMFNPIFDGNAETKYKDRLVTDYNQMFVSDAPQTSFVGHTHQDYVGIERNNALDIVTSPLDISAHDRAIVNVGSAGEHNSMVPDGQGGYRDLVDSYLTYAIVNDANLEQGFNVEIIKVPYKSTLKHVYFDMIGMQNKHQAPYSPKDTEKVHDSLEKMGVDVPEQEELRRPR